MTKTTPAAVPSPWARVLVWDAPTRLCHGLLTACLAGAYATDRDEWQPVHETLGDTTIGLVLFRFFWGFAGCVMRGLPLPWPGRRPSIHSCVKIVNY